MGHREYMRGAAIVGVRSVSDQAPVRSARPRTDFDQRLDGVDENTTVVISEDAYTGSRENEDGAFVLRGIPSWIISGGIEPYSSRRIAATP